MSRPALLHDGSAEHVPYLAMQWIEGRRITDHADTVRRPWDSQARATLLRLAVSLLDAYVALHERGVVHADVHPKNVLIGPDGNVTIIDFGFVRVAGITDAAVPRAGVMAFWEPEWAQASAAGRPAPAATTASDQFALGALIYLMLTGRHYVEAVGELPQVIRRIAQEAPRPFSEHGLPAWPGSSALIRSPFTTARSRSFRNASAGCRFTTRRPEPRWSVPSSPAHSATRRPPGTRAPSLSSIPDKRATAST